MSEIERVAAALMRVVLTPTEATRLRGIITARTISDEPLTERPSVREALQAVRAAAYEIHDPGTHDHGQHIVHTADAHGIGGDWPLHELERVITVAGRSRLSWTDDERHALRIDRGHAGQLNVEAKRVTA